MALIVLQFLNDPVGGDLGVESGVDPLGTALNKARGIVNQGTDLLDHQIDHEPHQPSGEDRENQEDESRGSPPSPTLGLEEVDGRFHGESQKETDEQRQKEATECLDGACTDEKQRDGTDRVEQRPW